MHPPQKNEENKHIRQIGVYMTIPFILAFAPILGWLMGSWLDQRFATQPYLAYLLVIIGFAAGIREVYRLIKQFGNE